MKGAGGEGTRFTYKVFLLNDMIIKIHGKRKLLREEREREVNRKIKVLVSVCKANKGEREKEKERIGTCNKS